MKTILKISLLDIFLIFIFLFFSFSIFGLQPLGGNNVHYVPYMEKLKNSRLFPGDFIFDAFQFHPSLFYRLIVFFSDVFNLSIKTIISFLPGPTFFILGLISFLISQVIFKKKTISYLFLIFLLGPKYSLAFEPIGINLKQVTQTTFSLPLALLVILLFLQKKRKFAFFILGIIANIQPILSFQVLLLFTFCQIIEFLKKEKTKNFIKTLISGYFFTFLGSFPILTFLFKNKSLVREDWLIDSQDWLEIVKLRISHHFLPSSWNLSIWLLACFYLTLFYLAINWKRKVKDLTQKDRIIINFMTSFIPIFIIGFVFSEIFPIRLLILTNIFRIFVFFNFFCLLYASCLVYKLLTSRKFFYQLIGAFLFCLLFLPTSTFYPFNLFKPSILGLSFLFLVFLVLIILNRPLKLSSILVRKLAYLIVFLFLLSASMWRLFKNYKNWGYLTFDNSYQKEWIELQLWVNKNTSCNSLFIVPPNIYGFRVFSQRPIVGDFKDGASFLYHPNLFQNWWQRMEDLGVKKEMAKGAFLFGYREIRDEAVIKNLATKYKAEFLVSSYNDLDLIKTYNNNQFTVYKLN